MKFYFAPLVGVTGYVYRNVHRELFPGVDKYFAPFISPNEQGVCKGKEMRDILPEHNKGTIMVPQILTNRADYYIETVKQLKDFGYTEVNLNLGCPSGPVVKRGRGSGFLARKEELKRFLDEICEADLMKLSIKARLGKDRPEEIYSLMEIFNEFPLEELILHARVQTDFYKNTPNLPVFLEAAAMSKNPICYNGDLFTEADYEVFKKQCPDVSMVMLGRGLLKHPWMVTKIVHGQEAKVPTTRQFHNRIYEEYQKEITGDSHILNRMKQFWFYLFADELSGNEAWTLVKECDTLAQYDARVNQILAMTESK